MPISLQLGLEAIRSYKRMSYTEWHALAEFVDNSTQSYFNNRDVLDAALREEGEGLRVDIVFDRNEDVLRIADNSMGMSLHELQSAMMIGVPPSNTSGRSKYGMGLKTSACWFGDYWTIRTKKFGSTVEYTVEVDVEKVASGDSDLDLREIGDQDRSKHYTIVEISTLHRRIIGRTSGKVRDFLSSMYRADIRSGTLALRWQGTVLVWDDEDIFLRNRAGQPYRKDFQFDLDGKSISGWVGVLERGSRAKAGFSIMHSGRMVKGYPDAWRPEAIYGQLQGSNDLVNQRLVGEIHLDSFAVTHTKDNILFFGSEEDDLQKALRELSADYREVAKNRRVGDEDSRGPTPMQVQTAVQEMQSELSSADLADLLEVETVPPPSVVAESVRPLLESVHGTEPDYRAVVGPLAVAGYLASDASPNDPYVIIDATHENELVIVINMQHPHVSQLSGSDGVLNYLRQCTYDALAEWQARHKGSTIDPDTIKLLKDRLLRLPVLIEMRATAGTA